MTPWQLHRKKWQGCKKCVLHKRRKKVVLARGKIPCDVLFTGEAPGHSENVIGTPFIGPAGKLMQRIIDRALDGQYDYAMTNLVACIPLEENSNKLREPPEECIEACEERLQEFMDIAVPDVVIAVGGLAEKNLVSADEAIVHPAAMLRMDPGQRSLAIQRAIATISDAVYEVFGK
jgi:DNA polymerase